MATRVVKIHLSVYLPEDIATQGEDSVADYLNEKLDHEPSFFGEIDTACFTITDELDSPHSYFVSIVRQEATQGPLYGPFDYEQAEKKLFEILKENEMEISEDELRQIRSQGFFECEDGGGVFIVQSEQDEVELEE